MSTAAYSTLLPPTARGTRRSYYVVVLSLGCALLLSTLTYHQRALLLPASFSLLSHQPYCTDSQLSTGKWIPRLGVDGHTWPRLRTSVGYTCADNVHARWCWTLDPTASQLDRLTKANSWEWETEGCRLRDFVPEKLLQRLAKGGGGEGRGILFVGDSLQLQQAQSFECLMGEYVEEGYLSDHEIGSLRLEGGAGKVDFARSDYIIQPPAWDLMLPEQPEDQDAEGQLPKDHRFIRKWSHLVEDKEFVVLNTGAHWGDTTPEHLARYTSMAHSVLDFLSSYPHIKLIVRSTVGGHKNCSINTGPFTTDDPTTRTLYNWASLDRWNEIWREVLSEEGRERHRFLEIGATALRGDGHRDPDRDCLHYCLPGPTDTWNVLLNHIIMST